MGRGLKRAVEDGGGGSSCAKSEQEIEKLTAVL